MTDLVTIGFKADTSGLTNAQTQLDKTAAAGKNLDASSTKAQQSMSKFGKSAGMAGIQVQQFVGQIQGGQSALLALSQQGADLGFVLGQAGLGAAVGISATALSFLIGTSEDAASALDKLDEIAESVGKTLEQAADGSDVFSQSIQRLANRSEALARVQIAQTIADLNEQISTSARGIREAIGELDGVRMDVGIVDTLQSLGLQLEDMPSLFGDISSQVDTLGAGGVLTIRGLTERIDLMAKSLGITRAQAVDLQVAIDDFAQDNSATGIARLRAQIEDLTTAVGADNKAVNEFSAQLLEMFEASGEGVDRINLLRQALSDFDDTLKKNTEESKSAKESSDKFADALRTQIIALEQGAQAAEEYAVTQQAIARGDEESLPVLIELVRQKYALKAAQEAATEAQKQQVISQKQYESVLDEIFKREEKRKSTLQALKDRLNPLAAAQRKFNEELKLLESIGDSDSIEKLKSEFEGIQEALNGTEIDNGLSKLIDDVDSLSYGFSNLGNVIADSFGDAAEQLNNFAGRMNEISRLREDAIKEQGKWTEGTVEHQQATEQLARLNQEMYATQLGAIGGVLGASKGLFKEQSKEREALHRLEMGFMVAEMALAAQKAVTNAAQAIASAAAAPFPVGFGAAAAMSAIMAGVLGAAGIAFSGGSGGGYDVGAVQDSQGTGTEFGDSSAKADSVIRLQERFEDIQIDQLSELRGIRSAMDGLSNGIAQLALDIVGTGRIGNYAGDLSGSQNISVGGGFGAFLTGGVVGLGLDKILGGAIGDVFNSVMGGLFGTTKKKLVDEGLMFQAQEIGELISGGIIDATYFATIETTKKKLFGLSKSSSTKDELTGLNDEFSAQIGLIFNYLSDSVTGAIGLLGVDTANAIGDFIIDIGKVSFKDMTGEEIQAELEAIFSQQGDLIAKYMWPQVEQYQQLGEGALETLLRVTQEQVAFNDAIENLGLTLDDIDPAGMIDISQALLEMMGGLEEFSESISEYYDSFFTDAEKLDMLTRDVGEAFMSLNVAAPNTKEEFRALVESLDLTTNSGRALFAALMEIAPSFSEVIEGIDAKKLEEAEALEKARARAVNDAMASLERAVGAEKERVQVLIDGLNAELALRKEALSEAEQILRDSTSAEIEKIQQASDARIEALNSEIAAINELKAIAESEYQSRVQAAADAADMVQRSLAKEIDAINEASAARVGLLQDEIAEIDAAAAALSDAFKAATELYRESQTALKASFKAEIDAMKDASELRIDSLSDEIDRIESVADARLRALDSERDAYADIVDTMSSLAARLRDEVGIGGNTDVLGALIAARSGDFSLAESLEVPTIGAAGFGSASEMLFAQMVQRAQVGEIADLASGRASMAERQLNAIDRQTIAIGNSAEYQVAAIEAQIEQEKLDAQAQVDALTGQLNALLGIDANVLTIADAIAQFTAAQAAANERGFEYQQQIYDAQIAKLEQQIQQEQVNANAQIDAITAQVNAVLGVDDSVLALRDAITAYQSAQLAIDESGYNALIVKYDEQIAAINGQIETEQALAEEQVAALDAQLNTLLGIDTTVESLQDAITNYQNAKANLDALDYAQQIAAHQTEMARLDSILVTAQNQIDELNGIDKSVISVADAIAKLEEALVTAIKTESDKGKIYDTPTYIDVGKTGVNQEGAGINVAIRRDEIMPILESIARNTSTSANNSTRQRTEGQYVRIVE